MTFHHAAPIPMLYHHQPVDFQQDDRRDQMPEAYIDANCPKDPVTGLINLAFYFGIVSDEEMIEFLSQNKHLDV